MGSRQFGYLPLRTATQVYKSAISENIDLNL